MEIQMSNNQMDTQMKKLRCPLCNRQLLKIDKNSKFKIQSKCTKCDNIFDITFENGIATFKNDKIECVKNI